MHLSQMDEMLVWKFDHKEYIEDEATTSGPLDGASTSRLSARGYRRGRVPGMECKTESRQYINLAHETYSQ